MTENKDIDFGTPSGIPPGKVIEMYPKGHKPSVKEAKPKLTRKQKFIQRTVVPLALVAAGAGVEATLHPIQNTVNKADVIVKEVNTEYKIGQVINPDKVYTGLHLVNSLDENGNIIEPKALVTINGKTLSISLNDPNLSPFDRNSLQGILRVDEGSYKVPATNPDYKKNLANGFGLPEDIGKHFNRIPVAEGLESRAVYVETGVLYTIDGRDYPVRFPLADVQPPLSTGNTPSPTA